MTKLFTLKNKTLRMNSGLVLSSAKVEEISRLKDMQVVETLKRKTKNYVTCAQHFKIRINAESRLDKWRNHLEQKVHKKAFTMVIKRVLMTMVIKRVLMTIKNILTILILLTWAATWIKHIISN